MTKYAAKHMFKLLCAAFLCSIIHIALANSIPIYSYIFSGDGSGAIAGNVAATAQYILFFSLLLALLLSLSSWLFYGLVILINVIACIYSYFVFNFGIRMSDELMVSMLFFVESNDISSSFDWKIFFYVPLLLIPTLIATHLTLKKLGFLPAPSNRQVSLAHYIGNKLIVTIAVVTLLVAYIASVYFGQDSSLNVYKIRTVAEQTMPSYFMARRSNISKLAAVYNKKIVLEDYEKHEFYRDAQASEEPLIVVFIVGEALRSDKLGINGYSRDTTPRMKTIPNLFSFKDVLSCSTTTAVSLPCMLTDESQHGWIERFSAGEYTPKFSFAKIFTDSGFDTNWISAANKDYGIYIQKDFHGSKSVTLSNELRREFLSTASDFGDLLLAKKINPDVSENTLYVLGTMGSHREYFSRYTDDFSIFKPDRGKSVAEINNAYDNTVVYLDNFIAELVEKLKDKNSLIFYTSDHGESLGENGVFLHGAKVSTAPKEQLHVPLITWMSDTFIQLNPGKRKNIERWLQLNNTQEIQVGHDHVFHSILDCSGFKSPNQGLDKSLSLCSAAPN